ncbi:MAG: hypothetical protein M3328_08975 [Chloroflexota bacterium]|nr:hypothetical protein [Chloroflexota bacterium]
MNLNVLEKLVREMRQGNNVNETSEELLRRAILSPVEHRSLQSLSWQIAASARHDSLPTLAASMIQPYRVWI